MVLWDEKCKRKVWQYLIREVAIIVTPELTCHCSVATGNKDWRLVWDGRCSYFFFPFEVVKLCNNVVKYSKQNLHRAHPAPEQQVSVNLGPTIL